MRICVIIPVYNEAAKIGTVVKGIRAKGLDVVVVDDGSTDASGHIARSEGATVIRNEPRQGKGVSLQIGFEHALRSGYSGVLTIDGDGQHDPDDIEKFFTQCEKTPQSVINGNRMADPRGMPAIRILTNRFMSFVISLICRQKIPDTQCGYRYIGRSVLEGLKLVTTDFEIETEILIKASKKGFPILSIPIRTIYDGEESKISPFRDTVRFFSYLIREMCSPLR